VGKVKAAYASKMGAADAGATRDRFQAIIKRLSQEYPAPAGGMPRGPGMAGGKRLVAIAASTGGPLALQHVLSRLPSNLDAGVVIVLHISAGFTRPLTDRLDGLSPLAVREAEDGMPIVPGVVLVSPTGVHLTVERSLSGPGRGTDGSLVARLNPEPVDALHRPSADVLFYSIARCCPTETCAAILTGMGDDGALGLRAIRQGGGYTIAQDEATSVVYGMPRRAVELGGVDVSLPIEQIAGEIARVTAAS
jgi:two-component system chemotaxis response regulator CheB